MLRVLLKIIVSVITNFRKSNRLCVFTYHRVGNLSRVDAMSEEVFEKHLIWINRYFNPVSLSEGMKLQKQGRLPKRSVVITVDDGYLDIYDTIQPLLKKHNLTATFFISTSGLDNGSLWDDKICAAVLDIDLDIDEFSFDNQIYSIATYNQRVACAKSIISKAKYKTLIERDKLIQQLILQTNKTPSKNQFLSDLQVKSLFLNGMEIGAHTVNHPILLCEDSITAKKEMLESKNRLEAIIGSQVNYLAYPNGKKGIDFNHTHEELAKECGFKGALSTDLGSINGSSKELYCLRRLAPWDITEIKFCLRLALNFT